MTTLKRIWKEIGIAPEVDEFQGRPRVHVPGYSLAVADTLEEAAREALELARKEAEYQRWRATHRYKGYYP